MNAQLTRTEQSKCKHKHVLEQQAAMHRLDANRD